MMLTARSVGMHLFNSKDTCALVGALVPVRCHVRRHEVRRNGDVSAVGWHGAPDGWSDVVVPQGGRVDVVNGRAQPARAPVIIEPFEGGGTRAQPRITPAVECLQEAAGVKFDLPQIGVSAVSWSWTSSYGMPRVVVASV